MRGFFFLFSGPLTKSTLIWLFEIHAIGDETRMRGNETKHEQHLYFITLLCIVLFLGSIKRLDSGAEDIRTMTLHHLEEFFSFLVV